MRSATKPITSPILAPPPLRPAEEYARSSNPKPNHQEENPMS